MKLNRLIPTLLLSALAGLPVTHAAGQPIFSESFEGLVAPSDSSQSITLPRSWGIKGYSDGVSAKPMATIAKGKDGKQALRYTATFGGETYWGVICSTPAIATQVNIYGVPTKFTFEILSAAGREIEVLIHSQDQAYEETGTLAKKFPLKAGQWTTIEVELSGASLGNFSVLDPYLVFLFHVGNNQGYGATDSIDITIDNIKLHTVGH